MDVKIDEWTPQHFRIVEQQMERGRGGTLCGKLKAVEYRKFSADVYPTRLQASLTDNFTSITVGASC